MLFERIPDERVRRAIDNYIQWKLNVAYRLGRWIREAEIVEDFGPLVEVGAAAKKRVKKAGQKTGRLMTDAADNVWRRDAKAVWSRLTTEQPTWGATKIAKRIQAEVPAASQRELSTVKTAVEGWRRKSRGQNG